jgi:hypothetical protein
MWEGERESEMDVSTLRYPFTLTFLLKFLCSMTLFSLTLHILANRSAPFLLCTIPYCLLAWCIPKTFNQFALSASCTSTIPHKPEQGMDQVTLKIVCAAKRNAFALTFT